MHIAVIPGNGGSLHRFELMDHQPADDVTIVPITLPGFGGTPLPNAAPTVDDFAAALIEQVEALPHPRVVMGHGIGGSVLLTAAQTSGWADGYIFHAPVGPSLDTRLIPRIMKPEPVRAVAKALISSPLAKVVGRRRFTDVPQDTIDRFFDAYGDCDAFSVMFDVLNPGWWDSLEPIEEPSVLLWGSGDGVLSAEHTSQFAQVIPNAPTKEVDGWGHYPMLEQPGDYTRVLVELAHELVGLSVPAIRGSQVVTLGSGQMSAAGISSKAARLDDALVAGLPVPPGAVISDGADTIAAAESITRLFDRPLAIRSAFSAEDTEGQSMAGHFHTSLFVEPTAQAVIAAVEDVRNSGTPSIRRDVLVMPMVDAVRAGVAFSEPGWLNDVVNVVSGQGEQLVSGAEPGDRIELQRLGAWEQSAEGEPWLERLQVLLRDLRSWAGDEAWDIEWADDGVDCWLLQIRPVTAPIARDEIFTLANHREILPDPPSVFMSSIIMANGRRLGGPGGLMRPMLEHRSQFEMFDGRPYINQSLATDFVRSLGMPTSLLNESFGGDDVDDAGANPLRMVRSTPQFLRLGAGQAVAVSRAAKVAERLEHPDLTTASTFTQATSAFANDHLALVDEMANLVSAMAVPLSILRRAGVLVYRFEGLETPGTKIMSDLRSLSELAARTPGAIDQLTEGKVPADRSVAAAWNEWLANHGHRGRFESDLSQPRFADDEVMTLHLAAQLAGRSGRADSMADSSDVPAVSLTSLLTPLWWFARRALVAREELRSRAMRGFHQHRLHLLALAERAVEKGLLPEPDAVWDMTVDELAQVDAGESFSKDQHATRRAEVAAYRAIDAPEVRRRFGAISESVKSDGSGIPLFPGKVEGVAWVLTEPSTELPDGFDPETTILIARSVDAGWVPTFGLVAGVAVDIGGDLSHGSIILRELSLPSITNTRGLTKTIATGDSVVLDASSGRLGS